MTKSFISQKFFELYNHNPQIITRAPGRIELIGNHTDYNLGTVIGSTINLGIWVALSNNIKSTQKYEKNIISISSDFNGFEVIDLDENNQIKQNEDKLKWLNYPLGIYKTLKEKFISSLSKSFNILIISNLPSGAGLSSSAALELSIALGILEISRLNLSSSKDNILDYRIDKDKLEIIKICKEAENNFVGVSCGILDQGVCGYGDNNNFVHIDCKTIDISLIPVPIGLRFVIFNTHSKHNLIDSLYSQRHFECMKAAQILGLSSLSEIDIEVSYDELKNKFINENENEFKRTFHVIKEIKRVSEVKKILESNNIIEKEKLLKIGKLLNDSHESSRFYFENSTVELDFIVDQLKLKKEKVFGCRLNGGGFGGAVMAIVSDEYNDADSNDLKNQYKDKFGQVLEVIYASTGEKIEVVN